MTVPLTIAAPVAAAGLAYLNAKSSYSYDTRAMASIVPTTINLVWRERRGTLNAFYDFEALAKGKKSGQRQFLRFEEKSYTYAQAYDIVLRYGHWLKTRWHVTRGEVIALDFQNTDTFVFLWLGLWSIGASPAFINYNLSGRALVHCVGKAKSRLMFIDPVIAHNVDDDARKQMPSVQFIIFSAELEVQALQTDPVRHPDELRHVNDGLDMAILIYTSGTTGLPKAAVVSWAKFFTLEGFPARYLGLRSDDVYYTVSCQPFLRL
jgi:acyl-CoA synthetase (AMP-forming)/AMP-acid ligase II